MANRVVANTGSITFDSSTFFGVELKVPSGTSYAADAVIYTFTEQELKDLCELVEFARIRNNITELTTRTYTDSV